MSLSKSIVNRLEEIRSTEKLDKKQFAQKLGISPSAYYYLTQGKRKIGLDIYSKCCRVYNELIFFLIKT